jgi:dipeptidyl aminopeptidase/acylaminoacyl peptidase
MSPLAGIARRAFGCGAAALGVLLAATSAYARPAQLDDVLRREAFGAVEIDPNGRWLALERRGPYASAVRFDLDTLDELARTTLWRVDLQRPGAPRPLVPVQPGVAYALGPFAPDGRQVAVFRLTQRNWELGVATLASGRVRWLGVTPERLSDATTVNWRSAGSLLVIARPWGDLPFNLRVTRTPALTLPARWRASAKGQAVVTAYGSGRFLGVRPQAAPRRLVEIDTASGRSRTLAIGAFVHLALSPDAARAALIEAGGDIPMSAQHPVQGAFGFENLVHRLRLLDLRSGVLSDAVEGLDVLLHPLAWSATSKSLLWYARRDGEPWNAGHLYRSDGAVGGIRRADRGVTPRLDLRPEAARAGWLGDTPLVWSVPEGAAPGAIPEWRRITEAGPEAIGAGLAAQSRDGLTLTAGGLLLAANDQVLAIDRQGRQTVAANNIKPLAFTQTNRLWTFDYDLARGDRLIGRRSEPAGDTLVAVTDRGPTDLARLPPGAEVLRAVGRDGALVRIRSDLGAETLAWVSRDRAPVELMTINRYLSDIDPPSVRQVRHTGPSGEALSSWLILPTRPVDGRPAPLIVRPYLGSSYPVPPAGVDLRRSGYDEAPALLAAHGYAVLIPSLPLRTDGLGPAEGLADRLLAIVSAAAADPALAGTFDANRLGVWGVSFGGFTTLAAITQTTRFKAAIAEVATSDLFSEWANFSVRGQVDPTEGLTPVFSQGWVEDLQGDMRGPPWTDPGRYIDNSPAWHADRVTTPLLLLHGDQDTFSLGQPAAMFAGLLRQNKDAELAIYWGQGHVIGGPGNLRDLYARAFDWLDRHLLDPASWAGVAPPASRGPGLASGEPRPRPPRREG